MFRKINHKTPIKELWDMIRKISGKNKSSSYTHLNLEGTDSRATSETDIADTLGEFFCHNSSSFKVPQHTLANFTRYCPSYSRQTSYLF